MSYPLITISIPVYNCEKHIEKSIQSALDQTYPNIEILLVDDKGKDNSSQIIRKIQSKFPNKIRIVEHEKNEGLSIVRNTGIDNAKGDFLFFLDGDDEITPYCIEHLYEKIFTEKTTIAVGRMKGVNVLNKTEFDIFPIKNFKTLKGDNLLKFFCNGYWPVSACNKLFNVTFFRKNNIYFIKGLFSQDELWSFHTALKLDSISFLDEFTYYYYLHSESIIHNKGKKNFDNWQTIAEYFDKSYKEEKNPKRKKLILKHLTHFKNLTLGMNWKAQKNETLWKESYANFKKLSSLSWLDYLSSDFSSETKKQDFLTSLPVNLGFKIFRKRYGN